MKILYYDNVLFELILSINCRTYKMEPIKFHALAINFMFRATFDGISGPMESRESGFKKAMKNGFHIRSR